MQWTAIISATRHPVPGAPERLANYGFGNRHVAASLRRRSCEYSCACGEAQPSKTLPRGSIILPSLVLTSFHIFRKPAAESDSIRPLPEAGHWR